MKIVSPIDSFANYLRAHVKAARDKHSALGWLIEKISPQKQFWPAGAEASYPDDRAIKDRAAAIIPPKTHFFRKEDPLLKAELWVDRYHNKYQGADLPIQTIFDEAVNQASKGKPLRALRLFQRAMNDQVGEIQKRHPDTANLVIRLSDTAPGGLSDNQDIVEKELATFRDALIDMSEAPEKLANYSAQTLADIKQALQLAYDKALEEATDD